VYFTIKAISAQYFVLDFNPYPLYPITCFMPIIKSAKKRVKVAAKARTRNVRTKRSMREALKAFSKAIESGKAADILVAQNEVASAIDTAAKKNVIHKNKAARQKAALAARAKAAGVKPGKAAAKKPAAAKKTSSVPKKTAKTPAKKSAAKKTAKKASPK
jgi:small subunit ribosomal protein S20